MDSPEDVYRDRATRFGLESERLTARFNRTANLRLLAFVLAAACVAVAAWQRMAALGGAAAALLIMFSVLVWYHARLRRRRDRAAQLQHINQEALLRLARDWDALPLRHAFEAPPDHPYALDLDVFGQASLFHLLDTTTTPMGTACLAGWLMGPAGAAAVRERQAAVAELAPLLELREELMVRGSQPADHRPDPEPFLAWAEEEPWLRQRPLLLWAARLSPVLLWGLLIAWLARLLPVPIWPLFLLSNLALWQLLHGRTQSTLARARIHQGAFLQYGDQIGLLARSTLSSAALQRLRDSVTSERMRGDRLMRRLEAITSFAIPSASVAYVLGQSLLLWNVHVLAELERWRHRAGGRARGWLSALGELEALEALAGLAHGHPSWALPELDAEASQVIATRAGHPLLEPGTRVDNDVALGSPGTFVLVTGSNMSGKSTLLRTLGLNIVLASAGGPVCAASLRLPPLRLWTSMRLRDSLQRGVSYFLAELQRLKLIVDAAREASAAGEVLCYLLDEILQGTNTAERQIAARRVIQHLAAHRAMGAVSTHDLTLAESPELSRIVRKVHFRETVTVVDGRPSVTFDYQLRPGPATSTNALRLLDAIGLSFGSATPR